MQLDMMELTPEAHEAIVECLRIAARRGRMLREAREREQADPHAEILKDNEQEETGDQLLLQDQLPSCSDAQRIISLADSSRNID